MERTFRDELAQTVLLEFRVRGEPRQQYLALVCAEMLRMGAGPSPFASAIGTGPPSADQNSLAAKSQSALAQELMVTEDGSAEVEMSLQQVQMDKITDIMTTTSITPVLCWTKNSMRVLLKQSCGA